MSEVRSGELLVEGGLPDPSSIGTIGATFRRRDVTRACARLGRPIRKLAEYSAMGALLLLVWELAGRLSWVDTVALPTPCAVGRTVCRLLVSGTLLGHIATSLWRVLEGFAISAAVGLSLGLLSGISPLGARLLDLPVQLVRPVPPIAWIPLAILWFGIGELSKVFIIFLGAVFPIFVNTVDGIRQTDVRFIELARVLSVSRLKLIRSVVVPGALPAIMTGLRLGVGNAWICVLAAELIAAERGIGYVIVDGRELSQPDVVIAGMLAIGVVGKLMDFGLKRLEVRVFSWKRQYTGD
ncbi:MAG: ABC transporter permease [Polyangiaceae bacterium]